MNNRKLIRITYSPLFLIKIPLLLTLFSEFLLTIYHILTETYKNVLLSPIFSITKITNRNQKLRLKSVKSYQYIAYVNFFLYIPSYNNYIKNIFNKYITQKSWNGGIVVGQF